MTLSAGTYLSEKFLEHPDEDVCSEVNTKLKEYMSAMEGLCEEEASQIMCKSLTNMFKGLHADKLHNCHFDCLRPVITDANNHHVHQNNNHLEEQEEGAAQPGQASPADGNDLNSGNSAIFSPILLLICLVLLIR